MKRGEKREGRGGKVIGGEREKVRMNSGNPPSKITNILQERNSKTGHRMEKVCFTDSLA